MTNKPVKSLQDLSQDYHSTLESIDFTEQPKVDITPLKSGGSNFKTHVLIKHRDGSYQYKPSTLMAIFCSIFLIMGLGFLFGPIIASGFIDIGNNKAPIFFSLFGLVFALAGGFLFYNFYQPIIFNQRNNRYSKGYKKPLFGKQITEVPFSSIKALQIIGEDVRGKNSTYSSFELNLVLQDHTRLNVVDHGNLKSIIADATTLSKMLNVPIWHAETE